MVVDKIMSDEIYPEHEKLDGIKHLSQPLGGFLEWLQSQGYEICENISRKYVNYEPVHKNTRQWLAEYFEIDLVKLDEEKVKMLEQIRAAQQRKKQT